MSKTDKTNPWWVGRPWEPLHRYNCRDYRGLYVQRVAEYVDCDLPDEPPKRYDRKARWRGRPTGCFWEPEWPNYYSKTGNKHWARERHVQEFANRQERGIRAAWRDTVRLLKATPVDLVDDIPLPDPRHRHFALWDRW